MELEPTEMVWKTEVTLMGMVFGIEVFTRANGKCFALTRYSPEDIFVTDGQNEEDALMQHSAVLPLAVGCRKRRDMTAGHEVQNQVISCQRRSKSGTRVVAGTKNDDDVADAA